MGIIEKIKEIEAEMARTQKNKATGTVKSNALELVDQKFSSGYALFCLALCF